MSVEYLREFVVLAEKLNFTSASKALNITQPALSNHIKSLEREFGFVLLERSSSEGARLTKAGRVVYERSERLVRAYEEMVEDARKVQREVSGRIVLQLPRSELCGELIMAVKDFMAHHPNIDVDIRPWCQADSLDEIEAGASTAATSARSSASTRRSMSAERAGWSPSCKASSCCSCRRTARMRRRARSLSRT